MHTNFDSKALFKMNFNRFTKLKEMLKFKTIVQQMFENLTV